MLIDGEKRTTFLEVSLPGLPWSGNWPSAVKIRQVDA